MEVNIPNPQSVIHEIGVIYGMLIREDFIPHIRFENIQLLLEELNKLIERSIDKNGRKS